MASRDIANMHLFLEMKRSFPELPEEVIRRNIHKWQDDRKKCLYYLRKEREQYYCSKQGFSGCVSVQGENNSNCTNTNNDKRSVNNEMKSTFISQVDSPVHMYKEDLTVGKSSKRSEKVIYLNPCHQVKNQVETSSKIPKSPLFSVMYRNHVTSGHSSQLLSVSPVHKNYHNKTASVILHNKDFDYTTNDKLSNPQSKKHKVSLSFTPNLSNHEKIIIPEPSTCVSTFRKASSGRHFTSIHLELQPDAPHKPAVKISTASDGTQLTSRKENFDSCIHISFTSHGTTFSAQRTGFLNQTPVCKCKNKADTTQFASTSSNVKNSVPSYKQTNFPRSKWDSTQVKHSHPSQSYRQEVSPVFQKPPIEVRKSSVCGKSSRHSVDCNNDIYYSHSRTFPENKEIRLPQNRIIPNKNESIQPPYVQAVIHHQKLRLEVLKNEFRKQHSVMWQIMEEMKNLEQLLRLKKNEGNSLTYSEVITLKEGNDNLREECKILSMELRKLESNKGLQFVKR